LEYYRKQNLFTKDIEKINREVITGSYCPLRNNTPLKEVRGGMGDIFIKMAN